jgi:hypothetical protein
MTGIATIDAARVNVQEHALQELRTEIRGAVLEPSDFGHGDVHQVFNAMHPSRHAVTVRCSGTADVVAAVNCWGDLSRFGNGGTYLNFTGLAGEQPGADVQSAFGGHLERLAKLKATYDPDNLFRINHNVQPA